MRTPVRRDQNGYQKRPQRIAQIATHLKQRLSQPPVSARGERSEARGFGMEYRRTDTRQRRHGQYARERGCIGQSQQPDHHDGHTRRQSPRRRAFVEIESGQRLKDRTGQLEYQRDETDLGETERQIVLQHRIDGRNDRLQRIVKKVRHAQSPQNAECDAGRSPAPVLIHRKIVLSGSSVAVRSSSCPRSEKRQNHPSSAEARRKTAQRYAFLPCIQPNPEANLHSAPGCLPFCHKLSFPATVTAEYGSACVRSTGHFRNESFAHGSAKLSYVTVSTKNDPPQRFLTVISCLHASCCTGNV